MDVQDEQDLGLLIFRNTNQGHEVSHGKNTRFLIDLVPFPFNNFVRFAFNFSSPLYPVSPVYPCGFFPPVLLCAFVASCDELSRVRAGGGSWAGLDIDPAEVGFVLYAAAELRP